MRLAVGTEETVQLALNLSLLLFQLSLGPGLRVDTAPLAADASADPPCESDQEVQEEFDGNEKRGEEEEEA